MLKKFIQLYKPHLVVFILVLISSIIVSFIDLIIPFITSNLINVTIYNKDANGLKTMAIILVTIFILKSALTYITVLHGHMVGVKIEFKMRRNLYQKILSLPVKYFDNNSVGRLMSRITNDLNEISEVAHHGPEDVLMMVVLFIGSSIMMIIMNVQLALAIIILVPIIIIINGLSRKKFYDTFMQLKSKLANINSQANDTFSGIRQVKSFSNEDYEIKNFDHYNDEFYHAKRNSYLVMAKYFAALRGYFGILSLTTLVFGGYLVFNNEMQVGELTAFIMYTALFQRPIDMFSNFIQDYNKAATGFRRYLDIIELESSENDLGHIELKDVKGHIEFRNVYFKYDDSQEYIFEDFSLEILPGQTIALVGESGAGKTTLCNLLSRYYEIEKGSILIDGIDIRQYTLSSLRTHLGYVSQDVFVFSGTIYDNIIYGDLTKSKQDVILASTRARLDDFIESLAYKYDSYIGERGTKLSGGQKQRLSLARVFLKQPEILILDEATSALDNHTEREIQEVIDDVCQNKTNIVVAHRLSTIKNANKIIVFSKHGILEEGSHEELYNRKQAYYYLYQSSLRID